MELIISLRIRLSFDNWFLSCSLLLRLLLVFNFFLDFFIQILVKCIRHLLWLLINQLEQRLISLINLVKLLLEADEGAARSFLDEHARATKQQDNCLSIHFFYLCIL